MKRPVVYDFCAGLGGWTRGFLAEGFDAVGFDIERHVYGEKRYPAQLVLQDIRTLRGDELRDAAAFVGSPPCQKYSYMAMPWTRAKELAAWYREDNARIEELNDLFAACLRIQREACAAAGHHIPLVIENVKGAQPWLAPLASEYPQAFGPGGSARAHFGSYFLFGDVDSVGGRIVAGEVRFGQTLSVGKSQKFNPDGTAHGPGSWFAIANSKNRGAATKNDGGSWFGEAHNTESGTGRNPVNGNKGTGGSWFTPDPSDRTQGHWKEAGCVTRCYNSKSNARKAASAQIAEIPEELASYIARMFKPSEYMSVPTGDDGEYSRIAKPLCERGSY